MVDSSSSQKASVTSEHTRLPHCQWQAAASAASHPEVMKATAQGTKESSEPGLDHHSCLYVVPSDNVRQFSKYFGLTFSAMAYTVAWMCIATSSGMMLASTTRRLRVPYTLNEESTTPALSSWRIENGSGVRPTSLLPGRHRRCTFVNHISLAPG